jgi:hypothetical protein
LVLREYGSGVSEWFLTDPKRAIMISTRAVRGFLGFSVRKEGTPTLPFMLFIGQSSIFMPNNHFEVQYRSATRKNILHFLSNHFLGQRKERRREGRKEGRNEGAELCEREMQIQSGLRARAWAEGEEVRSACAAHARRGRREREARVQDERSIFHARALNQLAMKKRW